MQHLLGVFSQQGSCVGYREVDVISSLRIETQDRQVKPSNNDRIRDGNSMA